MADGHADHELLLGVYAHLEAGEVIAEMQLDLTCDDKNECGWRIPVPYQSEIGLGTTLTPTLLAELAQSHDKYYVDAWQGDGEWIFDGSVKEEIPPSLRSVVLDR